MYEIIWDQMTFNGPYVMKPNQTKPNQIIYIQNRCIKMIYH